MRSLAYMVFIGAAGCGPITNLFDTEATDVASSSGGSLSTPATSTPATSTPATSTPSTTPSTTSTPSTTPSTTTTAPSTTTTTTSFSATWPNTEVSVDAQFAYESVVHDLDGDGFLDLVIRSWDGVGRVSWSRGPLFAADQPLATSLTGAIGSLAVADIDGDGLDDAVFADDDVAWVRNLGGGLFAARAWLIPLVDATQLVLGDLDRDGDDDIVVSTTDRRLHWFDDTGAGFAAAVDLGEGWYPRLVDVDGDGDDDIVTIRPDGAAMDWVENLGSAFAPTAELFPVASSALPWTAADLDRDGDQDAIVVNNNLTAGWYTTGWHENLGGGTFSEMSPFSGLPDRTVGLGAADLDSDGDLDPIIETIFASDGCALRWLPNQGGGTFGAGVCIGNIFLNIESIGAADLDGDGDRDLVLTGYGSYWAATWGLVSLRTNDGVTDSDNDGLADHAEIDLGTDPENPDTDDGGESDGDEVASYHDPLDPADDNLDTPPAETTTTSGPADTGAAETGETGGTDDTDTGVGTTLTPPTDTTTETSTAGGGGPCSHGPSGAGAVGVFLAILGLRRRRMA